MRVNVGSKAWSRLACIATLGCGVVLLGGCATGSTYVQPTVAGSGGYYTSSGTAYPAASYYDDDMYAPGWNGWGDFGVGWPYTATVGFGWGSGFGYWPGFTFGFGVTSILGFPGWPIGWYTAPWYTSNLPLLSSCLYRSCGRWHHGYWRYGQRNFAHWNRGHWHRGQWNRLHHNPPWHHHAHPATRVTDVPSQRPAAQRSWVRPLDVGPHAVRVNRSAFARQYFVHAPDRVRNEHRTIETPPAMYRPAQHDARPALRMARIAAGSYTPRANAGFHRISTAIGQPLPEAHFAASMSARPVSTDRDSYAAARPVTHTYAPTHFAAPAPTAHASTPSGRFTATKQRR